MTLRKRAIGLMILVAMIGGLLAATTTATAAVLEETVNDVGNLDLILDATNGQKLEYDDFDAVGVDNTQQLVANGDCSVGSSGDSLVSLVGADDPFDAGAYAGLSNYSLGTKSDVEGEGTPCGLVDRIARGRNNRTVSAQTLTLELERGSGDVLDDLYIHGGQLAIRLKGTGTIALIELIDESGATIWFTTEACDEVSDCGPDSGNDIRDVSIPACADPCGDLDEAYLGVAIRLSVLSDSGGSTGLEDAPERGAIYDSHLTIAEQFDGVLGCDFPANVATATGDDGTEGTFTRIRTNELDPAECFEPVKPYRLRINADGIPVDFEPDSADGVETLAAYRGDIWLSHHFGNPLPDDEIEYNRDPDDPSVGFQLMQVCFVRDLVTSPLVGDPDDASAFPELETVRPGSTMTGPGFPTLIGDPADPGTDPGTGALLDSDGQPATACVVAYDGVVGSFTHWVIYLEDDPQFR